MPSLKVARCIQLRSLIYFQILTFTPGVIRAAGVSNLGIRHLEQLYSAGLKVPIAVNQMDLHPFMRRKELVEFCKSKGIYMEVSTAKQKRIWGEPAEYGCFAPRLGLLSFEVCASTTLPSRLCQTSTRSPPPKY